MNRRRRRNGQTLAEFALVFPIFMIMLLGLFDVGRAVFAYNSLTNAAREAARLAVVNQDEASVATRAQETAFGVAISTAPADLIDFFRQSPAQDVTANPTCPAADLSVGCVAVVRASASWQPITPIIGAIVGPITITARSELPIEFVCPTSDIPRFSAASSCPKQP